jgi:hypothetical protein
MKQWEWPRSVAGAGARAGSLGLRSTGGRESQMDDAKDVVDRKFGCVVTTTLSAISRVSPGLDLTGVGRVQVNGEGLDPRLEMETPERTPFGAHRSIRDFDAFQDAAVLPVLSVEDPGAVA